MEPTHLGDCPRARGEGMAGKAAEGLSARLPMGTVPPDQSRGPLALLSPAPSSLDVSGEAVLSFAHLHTIAEGHRI